MVSQQIKDIIAEVVQQSLNLTIEPQVSRPEARLGDFATNVAFVLAKQLKRAPKEIAEQLAADFAQHPQVASLEAVNGFINLRMSAGFWIEQLSQIGANYAAHDLSQGKKVLVEFVSANPTGPLTIGNGRGGYGGDVLANVLAHTGHKVEREYYLNDAGNQINVLNNSVRLAAQQQLGVADQEKAPEEIYKGEYIQELAQKITEAIKAQHADYTELKADQLTDIINQAIEAQNSLSQIITWIKDVTHRMGIEFTTWFSEQSLHDEGKVEAVVGRLLKEGKAEQRDGALWLKLDDDRVLKTSDGRYTYLAADLAYHQNKLQERGFDLAINLWGADHHAQVASLQGGLQQLGVPGKLDVILFQLVRLIKDGAEFKVSKRAGTYITMDEILDEVPSDVLRFFFLMRAFNTPMDLDLDLAKEQSQKNPLYYVMYSYARANSILEQASARGIAPVGTLTELSDQEVALVRHLTRLPELLQEIVADYGVHRLTFYGMEVAKLFHDLYESERIIDLDKESASKRLYVIEQYRVFMELYFNLLGITPQRRMEQ